MSMTIGWYRTKNDYWYWFDGNKLWHPNGSDGRIMWVEPSCLMELFPSSMLEALVVTGRRLRPPMPGDIFRPLKKCQYSLQEHVYKGYIINEYLPKFQFNESLIPEFSKSKPSKPKFSKVKVYKK